MSCIRDTDPDIEDEHSIQILYSDEEGVEVVEDLEGQGPTGSVESDTEEGTTRNAARSEDFEAPRFSPGRDDAALYFRGHSDAVFAVHFSSCGDWIVSGSKDERAVLWNAQNGQPQFELTGFSDSVIHVGFSKNDKFVMAADMAGKVSVWEVASQLLVFSAETDDITWCLWHFSSTVLFAGTQEGSIWIWSVPDGRTIILPSLGEATTTGKLLPDGKRFIAGYADGYVRIWDIKLQKCNLTLPRLHEGEVLCVDVNSRGLTASGGADGLKFASLTTGKSIQTVDDFEDCVECVAFSPTSQWLAAGSLDGTLLFWDAGMGQQRHRVTLGSTSGVCKITWAYSNFLLVASLDGIVREYDARSGRLCKQWEGHTSSLLDLSIRGSTFATASEDHTVGVFNGIVS